MGKRTGETYRPSNGTEGMYFTSRFCDRCAHEKWSHTQQNGDKQCDILSRSMMCDLKDENYPKEWQYDKEDKPTCTMFKFHKWERDADGNWNDPAEPEFIDPNQLKLF